MTEQQGKSLAFSVRLGLINGVQYKDKEL